MRVQQKIAFLPKWEPPVEQVEQFGRRNGRHLYKTASMIDGIHDNGAGDQTAEKIINFNPIPSHSTHYKLVPSINLGLVVVVGEILAGLGNDKQD